MASERSARPARPAGAAYAEALRAWRALAARAFQRQRLDRPLVARERADRLAYGLTGLAFLVTSVPFWMAAADGAVAGPGGVPSPRIWDALGRARSLVAEGPWPLTPGPTPFSPLWTWLLAVPYGFVGWTGISVVFLAKAIGWLLALIAAVGVYNFALTTTGRRWPGILAMGLVALDPTLALGRVSGSEAPLVAALAIFAALAAVRGRTGLLSLLLAGLAISRPDGALIVVLAVTVLAVELLWRGGALSRDAAHDLAVLARLVGPAAAVFGMWVVYSLAVDLAPLPPLWADGASVGADLPTRLAGLWGGLLSVHPSFASGFQVATLAAWMWAARTFVRAWGPRAAFPILLPVVFGLSVGANGPASPGPWGYDAARLIEPALPWLALSLSLGLSAAGAFIWQQSGPSMPIPLRRWPLERCVACLPLLFWLLTGVLLWFRVTTEYAWGSRNVADLPLAAGRWLAANAPAGSPVGLAEGTEAVRGSSRRPTRPVLEGAEGRAIAREQGLQYLVAFRGTPPANWPNAREVLRLGTPRNVGLPSPELSVFRLDWSLARLSPVDPVVLSLRGYQVVDMLDVADEPSETRHFYSSASQGLTVRLQSAAPAGWIEDDGRGQDPARGHESFQLAARPGKDLIVGVRYDNRARGTIRFTAGADTSELRLRDCGYRLCEDAAVVVPNGRVTGPTARLDVSFVSGAPGLLTTTFRYWSLAGP